MCFNFLLNIANKVSNIGIDKIKSGTNKEVIIADLKPTTEIIPIINPKKTDPVSPKKVLAGLKLYLKNPKDDPSIDIAKKSSNVPNLS